MNYQTQPSLYHYIFLLQNSIMQLFFQVMDLVQVFFSSPTAEKISSKVQTI